MSLKKELVTERVSETGFRVPAVPWRKGFKGSGTRLFFIFCQIFGICADLSKFGSSFSALYFKKIITYLKNLTKKFRKASFNFP